MWDLWVRDHVRARWYTLLLISGVSKHNTEKQKSCVKTWFHITKIYFNLVCKGITEPCFDLTFGVQKNPVLALIRAISTETIPKMFKPFDEPSLWLTNLQEERECVLAVGIFLVVIVWLFWGLLGFFFGGGRGLFGLGCWDLGFFSDRIFYFHLVLNWHHERVLLAAFLVQTCESS